MNFGTANTAGAGRTQDVTHRQLAQLWAATTVAVALHDAEELLLDLTGWIARHPWLPGRSLHGDRAEFALVLAIITAAVLTIAVASVASRAPWSAEALVCVAYALLINGVSHGLLSLASWSPMPGVVSGSLVLIPLAALIIRTLPALQWTRSTVVIAATTTAGITVGAFVLAAAVTRLG